MENGVKRTVRSAVDLNGPREKTVFFIYGTDTVGAVTVLYCILYKFDPRCNKLDPDVIN
jgi:hypothetical protein